jgi:hypothetical protein
VAKVGRRPVLDDTKKTVIVALVSVGASQRIAARYVGCAPATIRRTAARDARFAERMRQAAYNAEIGLVRLIRNAAKKAQYWRAAAWMLERGYPQRYARRGPDVITVEQIARLLSQFSEIVVAEVPVARYRKRIIQRLGDLGKSLTGKMPAWARQRKVEGGEADAS